ncbi:hypothetical protein [Algoriphagus zhangzhouensis]|uniref:Uncharacterized protein n=1 Tax=Algoriphagus zhangzhouensis TaxID=1073327 RepID=A0A1M7ZH57_9BACT|nr:hypothetical protein [Algoriphagus zhangzhouensis]TDY44106.1 hypothetical protein A8938_3316 [Algoriphagus zhangzhouensis]SHO64231.1 hypothetical protein SAMN04488108_3311 [Algoriphagus zhangzhouensis]
MYKHTFLFIFSVFVLGLNYGQAQIKAVTEHGDTIYVYNNGTWSYELLDQNSPVSPMAFLDQELQIEPISTPFFTPQQSKKIISNQWDLFDVYYDESSWKRLPAGELNEDAEFALQARQKDIWAIIISEETPIEKETLLKIAKNTMKDNTGSEILDVKTESRTVNGKEVLRGAFKASISGITFIFDSYYYSDERGSVQFTTWSSETLWKKNESLIMDLLNGFVVL